MSAPTRRISRPSAWRRRRALAASCSIPAITAPSNYRATRHLGDWLKARGVIGIGGIDTRALTALIRVKRHAQRGDRASLRGANSISAEAQARQAREWPGLVGMDLVPMVTSAQRFELGPDAVAVGKGYGRLG